MKPTKIPEPPTFEIQGRLFQPHQEWWPAGQTGNDAAGFKIPREQAADRPKADFHELPPEVQGKVVRHGAADCWILESRRMPLKYALKRRGLVKKDGKAVLAYRLVWEHFMGPIPEGACFDHLCEIPRCLNPAHIELVTSGENTRRHHARRAAENAFSAPRDTLYRTYRRVICPICGEEFQKVRDWHTYCSDRCRLVGHKRAQGEEIKPAPPEGEPYQQARVWLLDRLRSGPVSTLELRREPWPASQNPAQRVLELRNRQHDIRTERSGRLTFYWLWEDGYPIGRIPGKGAS